MSQESESNLNLDSVLKELRGIIGNQAQQIAVLKVLLDEANDKISSNISED